MQILKVTGDHRVAIFAKEHIEACVELLFDYGYQAPVWALKLEHFGGARGAKGPSFESRVSKPKHMAGYMHNHHRCITLHLL